MSSTRLSLLCLLLASACATPEASEPSPEAPPATAAPADGEVDALLAEGRGQLAGGRVDEALATFERADQRSGGAFRTRVWVVRAWIEQERVNDALDALDALANRGDVPPDAPELDWLYGLAFAHKAQGMLSAGDTAGSIGMHFQDATQLLSSALEAEPERFADAWHALAVCAWYAQPPQLEVARHAAERAVAHAPDSARVRFQLGRIAFSQFVEAQADVARGAEAEGHWQAAMDAFAAVPERVDPAAPDGARMAAEAHLQRGNLYAWRQRFGEAAEAWGAALGRDPEVADVGQLRSSLPAGGARLMLETATASFREHHAAGDGGDGLLQWWLGYELFQAGEWAPAEEAFLRSFEAGGFTNAWYYVARGRYNRGDRAGAVEAYLRNWELDPADLLASLAPSAETEVPVVESLVGWCYQQGRLDRAATLTEICAETAQDDPRHWNNLGLFLRDLGESISPYTVAQPDPQAIALWERALTAYERALALVPGDPNYLNDTAVMLHYYLRREPERALELYARSNERATELLAQEDLPEELRSVYAIAKRDSANNQRILEKQLAPAKEEAAAAADDTP